MIIENPVNKNSFEHSHSVLVVFANENFLYN